MHITDVKQLTTSEQLKRAVAAVMIDVAQTIPQTPTRHDIESVKVAIPHLAEVAHNLIDAVSDDSLICPFGGLGRYYAGQGLYKLAESWLKQCISLLKVRLGKEHLYVATIYNNLAHLYNLQGRYQEAESFYRNSLELSCKLLGEEHPDVATSYHNLANLYHLQGKYQEAESFYHNSLELRLKLLGKEHLDVANSYHNLAGLYQSQGTGVWTKSSGSEKST